MYISGYQTYTMIVAYSSLDEARNSILNSNEVKFIKPSKPSHWESKIIECAIMCKALKTLAEQFPKEQKNYHFHWKIRLFWQPTTYKISYDRNTYTFEISTGGTTFTDKSTEIKNRPVNLYDSAEKYLDYLMTQAKAELPSSQYEFLDKRCKELKSYKK